jgi:DNA-directed RNA polymerase subunit M/transcription elongation factor TFIIS
MEKIRVQCPHCKVILAVNPALEGKNIICPKCKKESSFEECKRKYADTLATVNRTVLVSGVIDKPGFLRDMNTGRTYMLAEGVNLIGRLTHQSAPLASVPIDTPDLGFSRAHLNIRVMKSPDGLYHAFAYNAQNKNITTINGVPLEQGDQIGLKDGDIIRSSATVLRYIKLAPIQNQNG